MAANALNNALYDLALNACIKDGMPADRVHVSAYTYNSGSVGLGSRSVQRDRAGRRPKTGFRGIATSKRYPSTKMDSCYSSGEADMDNTQFKWWDSDV